MAKQKYKFERLTPIDNMDLDVYEEAIDYVFSNSDVKNVAISGAYSAGKSSVLASYKKKHDELRFLHILSNNFAESDLPSLFSSFEQWDDSIQEKIFDHAVNNISCIIDNQDSIPTKLIKSLLNSESVSRDEKLDLFAAIMPGLCVDDIQSILILLNLTDYLKIFDMRSRPKFEINNESEKLLAAFKECHLIDSYEESTTKAGYYKVARPKATKALSKEPSTVT